MIIQIKLAANLFKNCTTLEENRIREKLLEYQTHGLTNGADLKKISENHYQLRINRESRLDLIKHHEGKNSYYIAVQARPNHEDITPLSQSYISAASIPCEASSSATSSHPDTVELSEYPGSFSYYNNTYLPLDDSQVEASKLKMPFILSGAPGSGKTCAALEILINIAVTESEKNTTEPTRILFVTENPNLAKSVERMFLETDTKLPKHVSVLFRTPAQLYREKYPEAQLLCENGVDETEHCLEWLKTEIKKANLLSKSELEKAYQEFRIISKYKTKEEYLNNKGSQDTGYPEEKDIEKRKWLFAALKRYKQSLGARINLQFTAIESAHTFQAIVYDEALDGSRIHQSSIISLAENGNIAILAGHHQGLSDNTNSCHFIEQELFYQFKKVATHTVLRTSYRSFAENIYFSNVILQLKYYFSGGIAFKREMPFINPPLNGRKGLLNYVKTIENLGTLPLDDIHFAIIFDPKHKQEIIDNFGQINEETGEKELPDCAYTVKECKGLEFRSVVIYKPFTGSKQDDFEKLSRSLPDIKVFHYQENLDHVSRPNKQAAIDMEYNTILNGLFVGASRAKEKLVFFQPSNSKTRRLEEFTEDAVIRINTPRTTSEAISARTDTIIVSAEQSITDQQSETKTMITSLYRTGLNKNKNRAIKAIERLLETSPTLASEIIEELNLESRFIKKEETQVNTTTESAEEKKIKDIILKIKSLTPAKRKSTINSLTSETPHEPSLLYASFDYTELLNELLSILTVSEKAKLLSHLELILENHIQVFGEDEAPNEYAQSILQSWRVIFNHYPELTRDSHWVDHIYDKSITTYDNKVQNMSSYFFTHFLILMVSRNNNILLNTEIFNALLFDADQARHSAFMVILQEHSAELFLYLCEHAAETIASPVFGEFICSLSSNIIDTLPAHKSWENFRQLTTKETSRSIPIEAVNNLTCSSLMSWFFDAEIEFHKKTILYRNTKMSMIDYLIFHRLNDLKLLAFPQCEFSPEQLIPIIERLTEQGPASQQSVLSAILHTKDGSKSVYLFLYAQRRCMTPDSWGLVLKDISSNPIWVEQVCRHKDSAVLMSMLYIQCIYQEDSPYYQIAKELALKSTPDLLTSGVGLACLKQILSTQSASDFIEALIKLVANEIRKLISKTSRIPAVGRLALRSLLTIPAINMPLLLGLSSNLDETERYQMKEALGELYANSQANFVLLENHHEIVKIPTLSSIFYEVKFDRKFAIRDYKSNEELKAHADDIINYLKSPYREKVLEKLTTPIPGREQFEIFFAPCLPAGKLKELLSLLNMEEKQSLLGRLSHILAGEFTDPVYNVQEYGQGAAMEATKSKLAKWSVILDHYPSISADMMFFSSAHNIGVKNRNNEFKIVTSHFYHQFILELMLRNKKILVGSSIFKKLLSTSGKIPLVEIMAYYGQGFIIDLIQQVPEIFECAAFMEAALFSEELRSYLPKFPLLSAISNVLDPSSNDPIPASFFDMHEFSLVDNLLGWKQTEHILKKKVSGEKDLSVIDYLIVNKSQHLKECLLMCFSNQGIDIPTFISQITTTGIESKQSLLSITLSLSPMQIERFYRQLLKHKAALRPAEYESMLIALTGINHFILKNNPEYAKQLISFLFFSVSYESSNRAFVAAISAAKLLIPLLLEGKEGLTRLSLISTIQTDVNFWETLIPCISKELSESRPSTDALTTILKNKNINLPVLLSLFNGEISSELVEAVKGSLLILKSDSHEAFSKMANHPDIAKHAKLSALFNQCNAVKVKMIDASIFKPAQEKERSRNKASSSNAKTSRR